MDLLAKHSHLFRIHSSFIKNYNFEPENLFGHDFNLFYECMHIFDVILGGKKMKKTKTIP
jgi:hypothetical protein